MSNIQLPCSYHIGEILVNEDDTPVGCPDCGTLLSLEYCWFCGSTWLHFGTGFDDVIADAIVTETGDLQCAKCYNPEADYESEYEGEDWRPSG